VLIKIVNFGAVEEPGSGPASMPSPTYLGIILESKNTKIELTKKLASAPVTWASRVPLCPFTP
ncbi:MAG: hypothetical protein ACRDIB_19095, partial [Ardenticatenaceae bacterium]